MSDEIKQELDQLRKQLKEAAHREKKLLLELENAKLRVENVQLKSEKEIAGLEAELELEKRKMCPSSSGNSQPPLKRHRTEGSDSQCGEEMGHTLVVQQVNALRVDVDALRVDFVKGLKNVADAINLRVEFVKGLKNVADAINSGQGITPVERAAGVSVTRMDVYEREIQTLLEATGADRRKRRREAEEEILPEFTTTFAK